MGAREAKVEKYLDSEVKKIGGITRKWVSPGRDGVPDRIILLNGRVMFIEVKTVDGELTTNQSREHKRLKDVGAAVGTVYGKEQVDQLIEELKKVGDV